MIVYDEKNNKIADSEEELDLDIGHIEEKTVEVHSDWIIDKDEKGHFEVVQEYDNGGKDVEWVIDSEEEGHWQTKNIATDEIIKDYDGSIPDDTDHAFGLNDSWTYGVYILYTEEQLSEIKKRKKELEEADARNNLISERAAEFFVDGGKEILENDIEKAKNSSVISPDVVSFMSLAMPSVAPLAKDTALAPVMKYAPEYIESGHAYKKGEIFIYNGEYYRCSSDFTSQPQWLSGNVESLFYKIEIADDGIIVWSQPKGEYNAPDKGDKRHYPGKDGPVYESLVNDNAYSPDAYPANWKLVDSKTQ